jgi:hypothetical protein
MSEKPKGKFWQFHLLTLLLTMLAIGGLFWLNFRERVVSGIDEDEGGNIRVTSIDQGWPFRIWFRTAKLEFHDSESGKWISQWMPVAGISQSGSDEFFAVIDLCIAVFGLILFVVLSEWLIRRREARKA